MKKIRIRKCIIGILVVSLFACSFGMICNYSNSSAASNKRIEGYFDDSKSIKVQFQSNKITVSGWYETKKSIFDNSHGSKKHGKKTYTVKSNCSVTLLDYNVDKQESKSKKMSYSSFMKVRRNYSYNSINITLGGNKVTRISMGLK